MTRLNRNILCIDLKSFFASCECIERNLDPFTTPLVVAGSNKGAITLAVTPYLKKQGIKGRTRLYDIPRNIKYIKVPPRMSLYIKKSEEVVSIYLDFISEEDLHIYSIDECFLDVTNYLKMYNKTDYELAEDILKTIEKKTGLTATCGIGPNMLLAKVSMDVEAKKYKNGIAKWTYDDVESKLWNIYPLSDMWGIGSRMQRNLNNLDIYTVGDLAQTDINILKSKFGIIGEELWNHANGIDESIISDKKIPPKSSSISHSQILYRDYYEDNIKIIILEMVEVLTRRLRTSNKMTRLIGFGIGYNKETGGGFYHSLKLDESTDNKETIYRYCVMMFDKFYKTDMPIRKVSISLGSLEKKTNVQLSLFEDINEIEKDNHLENIIDEVKNKYGKNSILSASSLTEYSTIRERNKKIGGHSA